MNKLFDKDFFNFLTAFVVILITSFVIVVASANLRADEVEAMAPETPVH
ncbi:MAG: hypothetical protein WAX38_00075 [Minisyncoccia bacterium]